ncbi:hypothetical protein K493DRAFT_380072 [Basidiobolus meristosporus CBS 931.73]|uniref:Uncharacterized protein n=1 Tax=Basidiobolus meristosporus CBS 931.73 TaxID=1314790 RepID=A0A1Y1XYH4_9FUNG|nr:hypothetical protein K493DRAFT_380072 [Basidiobolus meristosporus CBS 931.73]|eukprot:ORX90800.1 hypothetical protein K493DRAFT_380072 [Basidiobolus meristosporus CBS 931.73]
MVARQSALCRIPDELSSTEAAPLLCAGITVYNSIPGMFVLLLVLAAWATLLFNTPTNLATGQ